MENTILIRNMNGTEEARMPETKEEKEFVENQRREFEEQEKGSQITEITYGQAGEDLIAIMIKTEPKEQERTR